MRLRLEARAAGVTGAVIPGYGPQRWDRQSELLLDSDGFPLWGAFGLHPWAIDPRQDAECWGVILRKGWRDHALRWGKKLVAVGEFGLDRARRQPAVPFELQREIFGQHLALARQASLPVILHLVRSDGAALQLLAQDPLERGGVIHAFSSQAETIPAYAELGLSFSYGAGLLRFEKVRRALRATPAERMMFETDGPQGLPDDFPRPRGPKYLPQIVVAASQILGKSVEYLLARHRENCARVFGFKDGDAA